MTGNDMRRHCGLTMIELVIAISIAGVVASLGFTVYSAITGSLRNQAGSAAVLNSMVLAKKRIDHECSRLSLISNWTEREVTGIDRKTGGTISMRFEGNALCKQGDTIAAGFERFTFSLVENRRKTGSHTAVLLWEGIFAKSGDWIGGAAAVKK